MAEHIFSFGWGQKHPETGESLARRFLRVEAPDAGTAQDVVRRHFGKCYGMQYRSADEAGVGRFGLVELTRDDWPPAVIPGKTAEDVMDERRIQERDDDRDAEDARHEREERDR